MTIRLPAIPRSLLGVTYDLPFHASHDREAPENILGLHRLFGWDDVQSNRIVRFCSNQDGDVRVEAYELGSREMHLSVGPKHALLAAISVLETFAWYRQTLRAPLWMQHGMYQYDPTRDQDGPYGLPYVATLICSPEASEHLVLRSGYLDEIPHYACRLRLLSERLTLCERERDWNTDVAPGGYEVALVRALHLHIPSEKIVNQMFSQLAYRRARPHPAYVSVSSAPPAEHAWDYLLMRDGTRTRLTTNQSFCITARDQEQWQEWCAELLKAQDPSHAHFVLCQRDELMRLARQDAELAQARAAYLRHTDKLTINLAAEQALKNYEPPPYDFDLNPHVLMGCHPMVRWSNDRRDAFNVGAFPLNDRGGFHFIGAQARLLEDLDAPLITPT